MGRPRKQPDPPDFREATDEQILAYVEDVYKQGFDAGLKAATPTRPLFETARDTALKEFQLTDKGHLDREHLADLFDAVEAKYPGEKLIDADRRLISSNVEREVVVDRSRTNQAAKPRAAKPSERHGVKPTEYEVVR